MLSSPECFVVSACTLVCTVAVALGGTVYARRVVETVFHLVSLKDSGCQFP